MNTDLIEKQPRKAGIIPSWLGTFITSWLAPISLLGFVVMIVVMASGVELGDAANNSFSMVEVMKLYKF